MSDTTSSPEATTLMGKMNNFAGNLNAQLYSGKDAVVNGVMDVYGAATSALYSGLARAAGESGALPGVIGSIGNQLSTHVIMADGKDIQLEPGMSSSVEIKTEQRRIIEYLLTPLLKYQSEALRER